MVWAHSWTVMSYAKKRALSSFISSRFLSEVTGMVCLVHPSDPGEMNEPHG